MKASSHILSNTATFCLSSNFWFWHIWHMNLDMASYICYFAIGETTEHTEK